MSATQKFFRYPFGDTGDRTAVPDATPIDGSVNYQTGYGYDYQRAPTDPLVKNLERDKSNQVWYDMTLGMRQYQLNGVPEFVPASDNGGVAVAYAAGARVLYTDGFVYASLVAANNVVPGTDAAKWRREGMPRAGLVTVTATGALPATVRGTVVAINAAGATTQTLPAANTFAPGEEVELFNINAGTATVQRAGADTLQVNSGTVTALALKNGDTLRLRSDGVSAWYAVGGTGRLGYADKFGASLAVNGYQKLPSGLIVQWGVDATDGTGATTINFPVAFPTACFTAVATPPTAAYIASTPTFNVTQLTLTLATPAGAGSAGNVRWWAVGQ